MAGKIFVILFIVFCVANCEDDGGDINPRSVEQGRTLVHHAMKRLSMLLPAFMFKLGIMFTMLLVAMITSTKSLLVGTLLLALGVGHFIATRFSNAVVPAAIPAVHAAPVVHGLPHLHLGPVGHLGYHGHLVDRSDTGSNGYSGNGYTGQYASQYGGSQAYSAWRN